ncbi:transposable element Tcb2 transposase [Trichonephila clavipes]|nr:transposable element Tcb2 transposase [Trichonephila clavipes]
MPLRHFRRQYEQLPQFEKGRIIGMMEARWSARRVARQLGHSDCVVRRCWDQWIREMSFTRRPDSGRPRQISRRENHHIVRNAHVQPTTSSTAIQVQVVPSLVDPGSSRTIRMHLVEGHLGSRCPLRMLPLTPSFVVVLRTRKLDWNQVVFSDENPDSISAVMTIVFVCGDPVVNAPILPLLYSDTLLPQLV